MLFTKMNGIGNDYIFVEKKNLERQLNKDDIRYLCDRNRGIGSDGIVILSESKIADIRMVIYNADGSRAELCGNALRCVAKYFYDRYANKIELSIETDSGIKRSLVLGDTVKVLIGKAAVDGVPYNYNKCIIGYKVNIGNPHFIVLNSKTGDFEKFARSISEDVNVFPNKTNVEFVYKEKRQFRIRVYERGSGETMACGSGTAATYSVLRALNICAEKETFTLKGGRLECSSNENGDVFIEGSADYNYEGELNLNNATYQRQLSRYKGNLLI